MVLAKIIILFKIHNLTNLVLKNAFSLHFTKVEVYFYSNDIPVHKVEIQLYLKVKPVPIFKCKQRKVMILIFKDKLCSLQFELF